MYSECCVLNVGSVAALERPSYNVADALDMGHKNTLFVDSRHNDIMVH